MEEGRGLESLNPLGWLLLVGGFLCGLFVGGPQSGGSLWLIPFGVMLAGLTILTTNMLREIWRRVNRSWNLIRARLRG